MMNRPFLLTWILYWEIGSSSFSTLPIFASAIPIFPQVISKAVKRSTQGIYPYHHALPLTRVDQPLPILLHVALACYRLFEIGNRFRRGDRDRELELRRALDRAVPMISTRSGFLDT